MGAASPSVTGGAGGVDLGSSAASRSGDAGGTSATGTKTFNFGANPNLTVNAVTNPIVIAGIVLVAFAYFKYKK